MGQKAKNAGPKGLRNDRAGCTAVVTRLSQSVTDRFQDLVHFTNAKFGRRASRVLLR